MRKRPEPEEIFLENIKSLINGIFLNNPNFKSGYYRQQFNSYSDYDYFENFIKKESNILLEKIEDWKHLITPLYTGEEIKKDLDKLEKTLILCSELTKNIYGEIKKDFTNNRIKESKKIIKKFKEIL